MVMNERMIRFTLLMQSFCVPWSNYNLRLDLDSAMERELPWHGQDGFPREGSTDQRGEI